MKDPLLKRFLQSGYSRSISECSIANGVLAIDLELLNAIGHWVSTEKILEVWSSHALEIEKVGYQRFSDAHDRRHYFKPWAIEGLLLPEKLFKMGLFRARDRFIETKTSVRFGS